MICPHCKSKLEKLSKHCPECGGDLSSLYQSAESKTDEMKPSEMEKENKVAPSAKTSNKGAILLILGIIAFIAGVCYFNSDSYKFSHYEFTDEQVSFLKSLGINKTNISSYHTDDRKFWVYAGEKHTLEDGVSIQVDKNYEITKVSPLVNFDKVIYDKDEKIVSKYSPWSEHVKAVGDFINTHTVKYNQSKQITYVDTVDTNPFGHVGIFNYLYYEGQGESYKEPIKGGAGIYSVLHYSGQDWIFFDKVVFSTTANSWTYYVNKDVDHEVVRGGVHETVTVRFKDIYPGMKLLAEGENPQIEFVGKHSKVVPLYSGDIDSIKEYIELYDKL